jgi:peroxiredoxin
MNQAPEFRLQSVDGEWVSLKETLQDGTVLLVFLRHLA